MPQRARFGSATDEPSDPASPTDLEEMVEAAFNSPVDNLQDVFALVFDVMKRQQVVIASLRDDLDGLRRDNKIEALESEVKELKEELATRPTVLAQPVVAEQSPAKPPPQQQPQRRAQKQ